MQENEWMNEGAWKFGMEKYSILWTYFLFAPGMDVNFY